METCLIFCLTFWHFSVISLLHGSMKNDFEEIDRVRSFLNLFFLAEKEVEKELGEVL